MDERGPGPTVFSRASTALASVSVEWMTRAGFPEVPPVEKAKCRTLPEREIFASERATGFAEQKSTPFSLPRILNALRLQSS